MFSFIYIVHAFIAFIFFFHSLIRFSLMRCSLLQTLHVRGDRPICTQVITAAVAICSPRALRYDLPHSASVLTHEIPHFVLNACMHIADVHSS